MPKRGNGEGSIYQRASDGRWVGAVHLQWGPKGRVRKAVYGRTRKDVAEKLKILLREHQRGVPIPTSERTTVGEFLDGWLAQSRARLKDSTTETYSVYVRHHLKPTIGKIRLSRLTPQDVERCLEQLSTRGLSARSVGHARAVLRAALNQALRWELVARNAAALARPPRVEHKRTRVLSVEEARSFVAGIEGIREEALYVVTLSSGLRMGEVTGLRWEDIDLDAGTLRVRQALQRTRGAFRLVEPKSWTSKRRIALPPLAIATLRAHAERQDCERRDAGACWSNDWDLVFTTAVGHPLNPSSLNRRFRGVLAELGLPQMRFHDLRHSCASLLIAQGVHPRLIMETLGHSQISLTMNTYAHVLPEVHGVVADEMQRLLQPPGALPGTEVERVATSVATFPLEEEPDGG